MVTKAESHQRRMAHREKIESAAMYCHFMVAGGWVTIAAFELVGGELVYGLSLCAPEDQFSRKRGRDAALKRLIAADRGWSHWGTQSALHRKNAHPTGPHAC